MPKAKLKIKNLVIALAALVFAVGVLGISVVRTTAQTSLNFKITPLITGAQLTPTPTVTPPAEPAKVDYYLPYPGILPDHFLYPLKMVRDRIWLFLTIDPVKKAELLLLFADKRLGAGRALVEGGKVELGISTLTKAEKYLEQAIAQAQKTKEVGKETQALAEKLAKATLKHEEVLKEVLPKVPDQAKPILQEALRYSQEGYKILKSGEEF